MKKLLSTLCFIASIVLIAFSQSGPNPTVNLSWTPSTTPTVVGYNAYCGTNSGQYLQKQYTTNVNAIKFTNLFAGYYITYFFAVTAVDGMTNESVFSNEVSWYATNSIIPPTLSITGASAN